MKNIKKRNIGVFAIIALRLATVFFPEFLQPDKIEAIRWAIDSLLLSGTAHSLSRTDAVKNIGTKIANSVKKK